MVLYGHISSSGIGLVFVLFLYAVGLVLGWFCLTDLATLVNTEWIAVQMVSCVDLLVVNTNWCGFLTGLICCSLIKKTVFKTT